MAQQTALAQAIAAAAAAELRKARKRQGLTQLEVSRRTGGSISKAALANYETGNRSMRIEIFWAIAKALGEDPGAVLAAAERAAGFSVGSAERPVTVDAEAILASSDTRLGPVRRWFEMRLRTSGARLAVRTVVLDAGALAALADLMGMSPAQCRALLASTGVTAAPVAGIPDAGSGPGTPAPGHIAAVC